MSRRAVVVAVAAAALALSVLRLGGSRASTKVHEITSHSFYPAQAAVRDALNAAVGSIAPPPTLATAPPLPRPEQWPPTAPTAPRRLPPPSSAPPSSPTKPPRASTEGELSWRDSPRAGAASDAEVDQASGKGWRQLQTILAAAPPQHYDALQRLARQARKLRLFIYPSPNRSAWSATNLTSHFPACKSFQWSGD